MINNIGLPAGKEKENWKNFMDEEQRKMIDRIENAAKSISGIILITFTLCISLLADKKEALKISSYNLVIFFWLISAIIAFFVIFPFPYRYSKISIDSFKKSYKKTIIFKYIMLIVCLIFYITGALLLGYGTFK